MVRDVASVIQKDPKLPLARDPVCARTVKPEHAKGETEYGGETYYFCSEECLLRFREEPALYASETATGAGGSRMPPPGWPESGNET